LAVIRVIHEQLCVILVEANPVRLTKVIRDQMQFAIARDSVNALKSDS